MDRQQADFGQCAFPSSVHEFELSKSERMKKKLGLQPRSKSECKELDEDKSDFTQPSSSQKSKKPEKVKKRQATVPSTSSSSFKEHTSRSLSSSFSCCQCQHPKPTSDAICKKS